MKSKKMKWLLVVGTVLCILSLVYTYTFHSMLWMIGKTNEEVYNRYGEFDMVLVDYVGNPIAKTYAYDLPFGFGLTFMYLEDRIICVYLTRYKDHRWITYDKYKDIYDFYYGDD